MIIVDTALKKRAAENLCPGCSRVFPPDKLFEYKGDRLCKACYRIRMEETTKEIRKLGQTVVRRKQELKTVKALLIVLAIMGLIAVLNYFFRPFA